MADATTDVDVDDNDGVAGEVTAVALKEPVVAPVGEPELEDVVKVIPDDDDTGEFSLLSRKPEMMLEPAAVLVPIAVFK